MGDNSRIGSNAVVLSEIPPNSTVVGIPGRIVKRDGVRVGRLEHDKLSDPVIDMFRQMQEQIDELKSELSRKNVQITWKPEIRLSAAEVKGFLLSLIISISCFFLKN